MLDYLGGDGSEIEWDLIRAAYGSVAQTAIAPLQDVFRGNWTWRASSADFTPARADRLRRLAGLTGRTR